MARAPAGPGLRPTTHHRYSQLLHDYILPVIGETRLDRLRPAHIQTAMDSMAERGQSPASVVQARAAIGSAMTTAVAWGLMAVNPVRSVKPPRIPRAQLVVPTVQQLRALIDVARGTVWEVPVLLATTTGMRRSEVLALRWCDVDLEAGHVRVTRSLQRMVDGSTQIFDPKTPRARREIALPAFTLPVLEARRRAQQDARTRAGMGSDEFDLVCDRGDGQPIDPSTFTHAFKRLAKEAGIPPEVRLHDARHRVATAMLEHDLHPAIASAVLGHASESFTMSTYQHVTPKDDRDRRRGARRCFAWIAPIYVDGMGCVKGRVRISEVSRLRLFAQAAGFCENPACLRGLFLDLSGGPIHVGEMAHIVAATEGGPRGKADLDLDERAAFDNVVLLCPTCHTAVDKAPSDFPVDELRRWRGNHAQRVREPAGAQRYTSRADARKVIARLFAQNHQIHADYGPESPGANLPESESPRAWHRKVVDAILPNSRKILAVLDANRHLLEDEELVLVERLRQHVDDLTARHVFDQREPGRGRFPEGADGLLS